jgi:DNA-binding LacI/PurR family transcriptional regulator
MRRAVSIQDIAQEAGVSHATVSRALHDSPLISTEVRTHIQRLARQMGYTPNAVAQSLKGQRTNSIGLLVTSISDPFYGRVVRGVEEVAQGAGIDVLLGVSHSIPDQEMAVINAFHRRRVDGIISISSILDDGQLRKLADYALPMVLLNREAEGAGRLLHSVAIDDYGGARRAVVYLIEQGHRAIAYLGAANRPRSSVRRCQGYVDALAEAGIAFDESWVQNGAPERRMHADDVAVAQSLTIRALQAGVSAIFCYNDLYAVGAVMTCRDLGIAVPEHVSIAGFDDVDLAQYITPPLTTVHQPKLRLGQLAMQMLLELMEDKAVEDQLVPAELVVRCSTAPAPAGLVRIPAETRLSGRLRC